LNILLINRHQPFPRAGMLSVMVSTVDKNNCFLVAISKAIQLKNKLTDNNIGRWFTRPIMFYRPHLQYS
jgi:hypothetical protein